MTTATAGPRRVHGAARAGHDPSGRTLGCKTELPAAGFSDELESNGQGRKKAGWFTAFAQYTSQLSGRPATFILALALIIVWGVTGPIFGYSDTWQLLINTGTTIVTFLMVFLIQHTQNRDTLALQVKLDELIIAMEGARNKVAAAEDLCDADLKALHEAVRQHADETLDPLEQHHGDRDRR